MLETLMMGSGPPNPNREKIFPHAGGNLARAASGGEKKNSQRGWMGNLGAGAIFPWPMENSGLNTWGVDTAKQIPQRPSLEGGNWFSKLGRADYCGEGHYGELDQKPTKRANLKNRGICSWLRRGDTTLGGGQQTEIKQTPLFAKPYTTRIPQITFQDTHKVYNKAPTLHRLETHPFPSNR